MPKTNRQGAAEGILSTTASLIDNMTFSYILPSDDFRIPGSDPWTTPVISRVLRSRDMAETGTFGPGFFCCYDIKLYFGGSLTESAELFDPNRLFPQRVTMAEYFDAAGTELTAAQVVPGVQNGGGSTEYYDPSGGGYTSTPPTTNVARVMYQPPSGGRFHFEIVRIENYGFQGRIIRIEDAAGRGTTISYKSWTAQQIEESPDRQWQINTVAGDSGISAAFTYHPEQTAGRWAVSTISVPNWGALTYSYDIGQEGGENTEEYSGMEGMENQGTGRLVLVNHPDGTASTFDWGVSYSGTYTNFMERITIFDPKATGPNRKQDVFWSGPTSGVAGFPIYNQASQLTRYVTNGDGEVTYLTYGQLPNTRVYEGQGVLKEITGPTQVRYHKPGWKLKNSNSIQTAGLEIGEVLNPPAMNTMQAPVGDVAITDGRGITKTLKYTGNSATFYRNIEKTTYGDESYETTAFNEMGKVVRFRDRMARVTKYTYNSFGEVTEKEVGLIEDAQTTTTTTSGTGSGSSSGSGSSGSGSGTNSYDPYYGNYYDMMNSGSGSSSGTGSGSSTTTTVTLVDVPQPEHAVFRWDYFPAGHVNAGMLKTEFDPLWDGSSADTHRTDYEYNGNGQLTKKLGPAASAGETRPENTYTYDSLGRLLTVVEPMGHVVQYSYDLSNRRVRTEYDDNSTEESLYGAAGSGDEALVVKTKDRRNVVTTYAYDDSGRVVLVVVGAARDADILDGNPDDSPINDRNEQSITTYAYQNGTDRQVTVVRDGAKTDYAYDYRGRQIQSVVYPYANKSLVAKHRYENNQRLFGEDPYGRRTYFAYRASDGALVRTVREASPGVIAPLIAASAASVAEYTTGFDAGYEAGYTNPFGDSSTSGSGYPSTPTLEQLGHADGLAAGIVDGTADMMSGGTQSGNTGNGANWMSSYSMYFNVPNDENAALLAMQRDAALNPPFVVKDIIQDNGGNQIQFVDERSASTITEVNSVGRAIRIKQAAGTPVEAKTETLYDAAGNAVEVRSPRYFDANDPNGFEKSRTVMTYDGANRVLTRTEAPGTVEVGTESYTYDTSGRQTTRTDARGKVWTTNYASCCGHSVASRNPLGHGSISNQNAGGLTVHTAGIADVDSHTSLLNPVDTKTLQETTIKYDALGRSVASTVWLQPLGLVDSENPPIAGFGGIAGTQGLTTQTLYDADLTDNVGLETTTGITVTNPLGGTYNVSLAAAITKLGEPIAQGGAGIGFAAGIPGSATVSLNAENEISFSISDAQGRSLMSGMLSVEQASSLLTWSCNVPDTTETIDSKVYLTSLSVDALGNTTKGRSNGLGHTVQSVDQVGNISTVQYDAGGNAIVSRDPNNVGQDCVYDALGRRTECTDTVGSVAATGYDRAGQQITATDAKNKVTHYAFDARGRRWKETDRLTYPTEWSYDAAGNLLSLKDAENQITAYSYNDAGQRVTEQYPDHVAGATIGQAGYGIITIGYDALGRRISKQDQQGDVTSYNFDMSGRMLTRAYVGHASGPLAGQQDTDTFTYDRAGRMLSGTKGRYNNTVTFSYDDRGQQTQETLTTHGQTYTIGYQKNALGQTTQLLYPDGSLVDRAYTNRGQLQFVNYTPLAGASSSVATFTYDAGGRETQRNFGNGLTTTRGYFADNQIQTIATPTVETLAYTYDANKNPTGETRNGIMAPYSSTTGPTGYDDEDRLKNWSRTSGDSQSWNLSPVHDWNSTTINGAVQTRTHGPAHELLTMAGAEVTNNPKTLTHDPKGNMATDDRGCNMAWDFDNKIQQFIANDVGGLRDAEYEYDVMGRRNLKNTLQPNGEPELTVQVYAEDELISEYPAGSVGADCDRKYVYGDFIDEAILRIQSDAEVVTKSWLHQTWNCTVHAVSSASGAVDEFYCYDSFGKHKAYSSTGTALGPNSGNGLQFTFTGREYDSESEFLFYRARFFSTNLGRFLSRDPVGYEDGQNLYTAYFVPAGLDPFGLKACHKTGFKYEIGLPEWLMGILAKLGAPKIDAKLGIVFSETICTICCDNGSLGKTRSASVGITFEMQAVTWEGKWGIIKYKAGAYAKSSGGGSVSFGYNSCNDEFSGGGCIELSPEIGLILEGETKTRFGSAGISGRGGVYMKTTLCLNCSASGCDIVLTNCVGYTLKISGYYRFRKRKREFSYSYGDETCMTQTL